jgi:putative membrane protein
VIADIKLIREQERKGILMMWGYDFGWGGWILMTFGMVLWIALLVVMGWAIIRWLERKTTRPVQPSTGTPAAGPSALEILQQRYARGEIDTATYEQMQERLTASGWRDEQPVGMRR